MRHPLKGATAKANANNIFSFGEGDAYIKWWVLTDTARAGFSYFNCKVGRPRTSYGNVFGTHGYFVAYFTSMPLRPLFIGNICLLRGCSEQLFGAIFDLRDMINEWFYLNIEGTYRKDCSGYNTMLITRVILRGSC